jgi:hypothetical protein
VLFDRGSHGGGHPGDTRNGICGGFTPGGIPESEISQEISYIPDGNPYQALPSVRFGGETPYTSGESAPNKLSKKIRDLSREIPRITRRTIIITRFLKFNFDHYTVPVDMKEAIEMCQLYTTNLQLTGTDENRISIWSSELILASADFIIREADTISKSIDSQLLKANRMEGHETTFMKQKNKEKEVHLAQTRQNIDQLCSLIYQLYENLSLLWMKSQMLTSKVLFPKINLYLKKQILSCQYIVHPSHWLHLVYRKIYLLLSHGS